MPIGEFARRTGLTASALRFYADSGVLAPAQVDPVTGYRFYAEAQVERATRLRRLRDIAMPLTATETVLAADPVTAARMIDNPVAAVVHEARRAEREGAALRASLVPDEMLTLFTISGPAFAAAVEQVLTAASVHEDPEILNAVHLEVGPAGALTMTATDRFRLATRTLRPSELLVTVWDGVVHGHDLRLAAPRIRRCSSVALLVGADGLWWRADGAERHRLRLIPEQFPDHQQMVAGLPEVLTRAVVPAGELRRVLEADPGLAVRLAVASDSLAIGGAHSEAAEHSLPAVVTGEALDIWFEVTTLHPAIATAVGPDVMLDFRGPAQPVTIRSADHGDLTTLVMPIDPCPAEQDLTP